MVPNFVAMKIRVRFLSLRIDKLCRTTVVTPFWETYNNRPTYLKFRFRIIMSCISLHSLRVTLRGYVDSSMYRSTSEGKYGSLLR